MVVNSCGIADEEAGDCVVALLDLSEVVDDLTGIFLPLGNPAFDEGIIRHQRGNKDRLEQVALNLGIHIVTGERQFILQNRLARLANSLPRNRIVDRSGE